MKARWGADCDKCGTPILQGEDMKPRWVRAGMSQDGKVLWRRKPKAYVHAPSCPKVTPNKPGQRRVDLVTGEILDHPPTVEEPVGNSPPSPHQESLL